MLTISPAYFDLEGGLERRVYELARKHLGGQTVWKIGLEKLSRKIGATRDLRRFKHDLLKVIARDRIPDYQLSVEALADGTRPVVVIEPRPRCFEPGDLAVHGMPGKTPSTKPSRRTFRADFTDGLDLAMAVYPDARVVVEERGIVLCPSRPAIIKRPPSVLTNR